MVCTASVDQCGDRQRPGGDAVQRRTITIPVGSSSTNSVPVTVTRGDDAYVEGNTAETVSISSTAGGN